MSRKGNTVGMRAPDFWNRGAGGIAPLLLSPFSALYAAATARRMARPGWRAPVPVICCGNVTAGGAGKTTVTLDLLRRLHARGINAHALLRGYGGATKGPLRVEPGKHDADLVGDEALLLAEAAPTWVAADRAEGARRAIEAGAQAIVMDDGLQNPTLEKDLPLLVVDGGYGFGNGRVIPAGPLREPISIGATRCRAAVLIGEDEAGVVEKLPPGLPVLRARLVPGPEAAEFTGKPVLAFCGIANPNKFFTTLTGIGAHLVGKEPFADHYPFDPSDMRDLLDKAEQLRAQLVTTPKDAVRVPAAFRSSIRVVGVTLEWESLAALDALLAPLLID